MPLISFDVHSFNFLPAWKKSVYYERREGFANGELVSCYDRLRSKKWFGSFDKPCPQRIHKQVVR
jgi:hypothetical protein